MRSYFKKLFRDNVIDNIIGHYDQFYDVYVLNIKYNTNEYVTWVYSDSNNGWLGRLTFNPEAMIRVNGAFYSFKKGEVYLHNTTDTYNTFYGIEKPSIVKFNLNQDPSIRKNYMNIEIDGTNPWDISLLTNLGKGYIDVNDFEKKENIFYAYIRNLNDEIDTALLSLQGIGSATINGLTLEFSENLGPEISIGDKIVNQNLQLVGTITNKTINSLTLNTVNNLVSGGFVMCSKTQSVERNSLLGYYIQVTMTLSNNVLSEVFAVRAEVNQSKS